LKFLIYSDFDLLSVEIKIRTAVTRVRVNVQASFGFLSLVCALVWIPYTTDKRTGKKRKAAGWQQIG